MSLLATLRPLWASHLRSTTRLRTALASAAVLAVSSTSLGAQAGTVSFNGELGGQIPTLAFGGGPTLLYTAQILSGFGNTTVVAGSQSTVQWWNSSYSNQDMAYGNSSTTGHVAEIRLEATAGFDLYLQQALFGGYVNTSRHVSYQLFSDDYTQSTSLATVLTGNTTPAIGLFDANGWGNVIRLQFTETTGAGIAVGRGPYDVGIQDIAYVVRATTEPPVQVSEPSGLALLAAGLGLGMVGMRRRRVRIA